MIFGFAGNKGSGKDTAGTYLVEKYGFERISFAAKLKESAAALFNIPIDTWDRLKNDDTSFVILGYFNTESEYPGGGEISRMSARQFLQRYGTESHREVFGFDFWVEQTIKDLDFTRNYVFTDVRFDNEAEAIVEYGGEVFLIERFSEIEDSHISERGVSMRYIRESIDNNEDFVWLQEQLDEIVRRYT